MRILLLGECLNQPTPWGLLIEAIVRRAPAAGHETHCLLADVGFPPLAGPPRRFTELTDAQIDAYRGELRRALDRAVETVNPDLIHVQHLWVQAHLALESGVPYLASTWGGELPVYQVDLRFRVFVDQAAENAGRIVADQESTRRDVLSTFGELEGRVVTADKAEQATREAPLSWLFRLYREVIAERRGEKTTS